MSFGSTIGMIADITEGVARLVKVIATRKEPAKALEYIKDLTTEMEQWEEDLDAQIDRDFGDVE